VTKEREVAVLDADIATLVAQRALAEAKIARIDARLAVRQAAKDALVAPPKPIKKEETRGE